MIRKARFTACVAVLFLLQVTVVHRFTHRFLRPDLLLLAAAFLGLEAEWQGALVGSFALGLLRDLGSSGRLGSSALLLVGVTAALLAVRGHLVRESAWTDLLLTFAYVLACGLISALAVALAGAGSDPTALLLRAAGQAAFTAALSPLASLAFSGLGLVRRR